jgi:hypothetical protein
MPTIGFLDVRSPEAFVERLRGISPGPEGTGYVEGENATILYRWAENRLDRFPALAGARWQCGRMRRARRSNMRGQLDAQLRFKCLHLVAHGALRDAQLLGRSCAHYLANRYDQAIEWAHKAVQQGPGMTAPHRILCASLAQAGRLDEPHAVLERVREMQPYISIDWVTRMVPYTPRQMPRFLEGLRKAGLT